MASHAHLAWTSTGKFNRNYPSAVTEGEVGLKSYVNRNGICLIRRETKNSSSITQERTG